MKNIDEILYQRGQEYGDFKVNCEKLLDFAKDFKSQELEHNNALGFYLSLKLARLHYGLERGKTLQELQESDSYVDLCGYIKLIKQNYNTYRMGFEKSVFDDYFTTTLKEAANSLLRQP